MTDLARDSAGRVVGVVLRDRPERPRTERARLVIGADGRLMVATRWRPTVVPEPAAAYVYGYWPAGDLDGYHWYYGDGLSAGVIPTNDGLACVFVGGPPAVLARGCATAARRCARGPAGTVRRRLADLAAAPPAGPVRFFRGMPARLRRPHGPGWALVGDAGWWKDPLSTHGITAALRDAELLARAVVAGAARTATRLALAGYQGSETGPPRRCIPSSTGSRRTSGTWPRPAGCCRVCRR